MNAQIYEAPELTVLGSVAGLTEQKGGGQPDQSGLDGGQQPSPEVQSSSSHGTIRRPPQAHGKVRRKC